MIIFVLALAATFSSVHAQSTCRFVLGFADFVTDFDPPTTGVCLENQRSAANGDAVQATSRGLFVWRKSDNWTAFTDGYQTWVRGPNGFEGRLNTERFDWEGDPVVGTALQVEPPVATSTPPKASTATPRPLPTATPRPATPQPATPQPAPTTAVRGVPILPPLVLPDTATSSVTTSRIKGEFNGWDGETIFELDNGQFWKQSSYAYYYYYAYAPKVVIVRDGSGWTMQVAGVSPTVRVTQVVSSGLFSGGDTVRSRISGTFSGWTGQTIFSLANGQTWQQASYAYLYHYAYSPEVLIVSTNGGWIMKVDGVTETLAVRRR